MKNPNVRLAIAILAGLASQALVSNLLHAAFFQLLPINTITPENFPQMGEFDWLLDNTDFLLLTTVSSFASVFIGLMVVLKIYRRDSLKATYLYVGLFVMIGLVVLFVGNSGTVGSPLHLLHLATLSAGAFLAYFIFRSPRDEFTDGYYEDADGYITERVDRRPAEFPQDSQESPKPNTEAKKKSKSKTPIWSWLIAIVFIGRFLLRMAKNGDSMSPLLLAGILVIAAGSIYIALKD